MIAFVCTHTPIGGKNIARERRSGPCEVLMTVQRRENPMELQCMYDTLYIYIYTTT